MNASQTLFLLTLSLAVAAGCDDDTEAGTTTGPTSTGTGASGGSTTSTGGASTGGTGGIGGTTSTGGAGGSGGALAFSFFVTSVGSGALGGNLGGLTGADAICQGLATAAGVGAGTWHAYLSTSAEDARDRIGTGPWTNFDGAVIAADVAALHNDGLSNGNPQHIIDETGNPAPANEHDIFTGSGDDGTLSGNTTCQDWTSNSNQDTGHVGHSDIPMNFSPSWNNAHDTQSCTRNGIINRGGSGRLYCFAL